MEPWIEGLIEVFGEFLGKIFFIPNAEKIKAALVKSPLLVAILSIIPVFGTAISYFMVLSQMKFWILVFADFILLLVLPIYPLYRLIIVIDSYTLTQKIKQGKEIGDWEFF